MDLFLKFESEEQALEVLYTTIPAVTNEEGEVTIQSRQEPKFRNIDVIGTIYKPTGETTESEEGFPIPVTEKLEGFHVNVRALPDENVEELTQYSLTPANPVRIWA